MAITPHHLKKSKRKRAVSRKPIQRQIKPPQTKADTLQRTIGNQAVGRLLLQRKMTLGPVGDQYEQEADEMAENGDFNEAFPEFNEKTLKDMDKNALRYEGCWT